MSLNLLCWPELKHNLNVSLWWLILNDVEMTPPGWRWRIRLRIGETRVSKLHKSRSPTRPLPVGGHLCVLHPAMTFCTRLSGKAFLWFFPQSGCVGIGRPVQYAFTRLSSSSVRPHPDLLHGQPFLLGLKYWLKLLSHQFQPMSAHRVKYLF